MILLFIGIQVIQNSHTHEYVVKTVKAKTILSTVTHPCTICDYNFAKDNDHNFQVFSITRASFVMIDHPQHISMLITSIGAVAAGRGPPSFC